MKHAKGFMTVVLVVLFGLASLMTSCTKGPEDALSRLKAGNIRYMEGRAAHPNQTRERREVTASQGQKPFATVLACSDSRVPVEILFDQGIGDIFTIRVAGNVTNVDEIASIEYAVDHLGTPIMVVLGHTHCGAVTAVAQGAEMHGHLEALAESIAPAVAMAREQNPELEGDALIQKAIERNVWQAVADLFQSSESVRSKVRLGKLMVVGALYDIESGEVAWLGKHPNQTELLMESEKKAVSAAQQARFEEAEEEKEEEEEEDNEAEEYED